MASLPLIKLFKVTESHRESELSQQERKKVEVQWEQGKHITFILDKKRTSLEEGVSSWTSNLKHRALKRLAFLHVMYEKQEALQSQESLLFTTFC